MSDADDSGYVKNPLGGGTGPYVGGDGLSPLSGAGVSGAPSGYAGPWFIEQQTLHIDYLRVPAGGLGASTLTISLTGATTTHAPINKTAIVALVTASYQASVDYASYSTSAYQQSQQFQMNAASGDPNGVSYGTITSATMGPMGQIMTSRPYYRRVAYTGTNQPTVSQYIDGATFPLQELVGGVLAGGVAVNNYWTDYKQWKDGGCQAATHRFGNSPQTLFMPNDYPIAGAYNVSKETWYDITAFVDSVGSRISAEKIFENPTNTGMLGPLQLAVADIGIPEYNKSHHEY
tara:strand:- start:1243 stop:2112 length:870 start_codon:yes stop_codon:yes gene_type:complete